MSSDTVLARKWRPRQFSEVVGQEAVVRALSQALSSGRLHHAYLFTGTRGVGKTTLARIFAKALNCRHGLSSEPCTDDIAQMIDEGRFVDLIEIDAASKTKVEDTRELLDNVQYAPSVGRFKIYLIDEVHMLSTHSFNALLKTLEEPPAHVKFLLATTDPHKLPVTILSRCLQFHLRPMTPDTLNQHLAKVLTQEGMTFEQEAIALVSNMAQGSVRDALSLLDQAIILGGGSVNYASTLEMLGLASRAQLMQLLQNIAKQARAEVLAQLHNWILFGADFDRLQQQLVEELHQLAMLQVFPSLSENAIPEQLSLIAEVSTEQVQIWLQVALLAKEDMRLAPSAQMGFEILVMRLLHFRASAQTQPITTQSAARQLTKTTVQTSYTPQATAAPTIAPATIKKDPMDFSLLLDMVGAEKKTSTTTLVTNEEKQDQYISLKLTEKPVTHQIIPKTSITKSITNTSINTTQLTTHSVTNTINNITDDFADEMANVVSIDEDDFIFDHHFEPEQLVVSTKPITTLAPAPTPNPVIPQVIGATYTPYPIEQWQQQLNKWRLNPLQLSVAERCVRLISNDSNTILLAYPPAEADSLNMMRDKLTEAIQKVETQSNVVWVAEWQEGWLSLQGHAQQASEQEKQQVQTDIAQHPQFTTICHQLGLTPQWDYLSARTNKNTSTATDKI